MPVLTSVAFVLPLGLDSFAIGATGRRLTRARWRIAMLFVVFEAGMPLIGLALGALLAHLIGDTANYVAAAAVITVGAWMLLDGDGTAIVAPTFLVAQFGLRLGSRIAERYREAQVGVTSSNRVYVGSPA
jgi:hypothetical protein